MDTHYIQPNLVRSYLRAFQSISPGILDGSLGIAGYQLSDKTIQPQLRTVVQSNSIDVNTMPSISTVWLVKVWEAFMGNCPPKGRLNIARRVGNTWWGGQPLISTAWSDEELYLTVSPLILLAIRDFTQHEKRWTPYDAFYIGLKTFTNFLGENLFCHIRLEKSDNKRTIFDIEYHPFTEKDDDRFLVFWGVVEGFCESVSYRPSLLRGHEYKYIHIDESASTTNRIVIVYPYEH